MQPKSATTKESFNWKDLWVKIKFTRNQLIAAASLLIAVVGVIYLLMNWKSFTDILERRKAVDAIQTCRNLLVKVQASPKATADFIVEANAHLSNAEQALGDLLFAKALNEAQQGIEMLEKELKFLTMLEKGRAAKFERIVGAVQVRRPGKEDWETAKLNMEIDEDSEIRTGKDGEVKIRFDNGAISEITPDSLIIVQRMAVNPTNRTLENEVRLEQGELTYRNTARSDISKIDVPSGSFQSPGAINMRASHRGDQKQPSFIEVTEGQGQFSDLRGSLVSLAPMTRIQINSEGVIGQVRPILRSPDLINPSTASSLRFNDPAQIIVSFRWSNVDKAVGYLLEVAEDTQFEKMVEKAETKTNTMDIKALSAGIYWWRVRAFDQDGTLYEPSNPRNFRVILGETTKQSTEKGPEVEIEKVRSLSKNTVLVEGHTTFGVQLFINDQPISIDLSGKFKDIIVIKNVSLGALQIEAIDPEGNRSSTSWKIDPSK